MNIICVEKEKYLFLIKRSNTNSLRHQDILYIDKVKPITIIIYSVRKANKLISKYTNSTLVTLVVL